MPQTNAPRALDDWLASEPDDDCVVDLHVFARHLDEMLVAGGASSVSEAGLELLEGRGLDICGRLKSRLLGAGLPLSADLLEASGKLIGALQALAALLRRGGASGERLQRHARALRLLGEGFVVACMRGTEAPEGLWKQIFAMQALGVGDAQRSADEASDGASVLSTQIQFKRICALSALQPESLTPRELAWICDYLELVAEGAEVSAAMIQPESATFWADPLEDLAPVACGRKLPPAHGKLLYFSAVGVARRASEHIEWLEKRISDAEVVGLERDGELLDADVSGLPLGLSPVEVVSLLGRLRERWTSPPSREHYRRPHLYSAQVCLGLHAIWAVHRGVRTRRSIVEWTVCNESPGGYGIISVTGTDGELVAGMVLALRRDASEPWSICLVRWIRGHENNQVELGLQVLSTSSSAVSIGFRGSDLQTTSPALMLPPLPGTRANSAIIAPAGTYTSRRFVMVREGAGLYVAQCRVLGLDMQTASIELFQYEIDPFPI